MVIDPRHLSLMFVLTGLWALFGCTGLRYAVIDLIACIGDWRFVRDSASYLRGGYPEIVARRNRRTAWAFVLLFTLFSVVGVQAIFTPSAGKPLTPLGVTFRLVFISTELILTGVMRWNKASRAALLAPEVPREPSRATDSSTWSRSGDSGRLEREQT